MRSRLTYDQNPDMQSRWPVLFPCTRNIEIINTTPCIINTIINVRCIGRGELCLDIVDELRAPVMRAALCDEHSLREASSEDCQGIEQ
jgi:hypothetical protein